MRFRILGPLEVEDDEGRLVTIGGPQLRGLLGVFLLHPNRVVSTDRLIEHVWGADPPDAARGLLQGRIAHLRRAIKQPGRQPLLTKGTGYQLEVREGERDLDTFDELVEAANDQTMPPAARSDKLNEALALWRGLALDGVAMDSWRAELEHLEERRLAVLEQRVELDLALNRHASLVGELQAQLHTHPLRERLWAQLLVALAGAGRPADALTAYRQLRRTFVDQLGTEPSAGVQEIHQRILTGDFAPVGGVPAPAPKVQRASVVRHTVPAQLPAAAGAFTGRTKALAWLDTLLDHATSDRPTIAVVSGTAGVGKTTVAVRWAHRVRGRFPDGQLYLDLRGFAFEPPVRTIDALAGFLQALDVPGEQIPTDLEPATQRYRTALAGRRLLIVLDNVRTAEQIRPLFPDSGGSLVLVTSRNRLTGLIARESARQLDLDVFDQAEAIDLLAKILGAGSIAAEPDATAELVRQCARLPLALRIAAANLSSSGVGGIKDLVAQLAADDRLDALQTGDDPSTAVRAAFDLSYDALDHQARGLFRGIGLAPGPDVTAGSAAALVGMSEPRAAALLERLASAHLVDEPTQGRYVPHDLLRAYARDRAHAEETEEERTAAIEGLLRWYLDAVDGAARALYPQLLRLHVPPRPAYEHAGRSEALAWLRAEQANLIAAVERAYALELYEPAWLLADALRGYFFLTRAVVDWLRVAELGLAAAEAAGSLVGRAASHSSIGMAQLCANNYWQALSHQRTAVDLSEQADWQEGKANALGNLAIVQQQFGELEHAAHRHEHALAINRACGSERGITVNLYNLGLLNALRGRLDEAVEQLEAANRRAEDAADTHSRAGGMNRLGDVLRYVGRYDEALAALTISVELHQGIGNVAGEGIAHGSIAAVHCDTGDLDAGFEHANRALTLLEGATDNDIEAFARNRLGEVLRKLGQHDEGFRMHLRALRLALEVSARFHELDAMVCLADAARELGDLELAVEQAGQASAVAGRIGYRIHEGNAQLALASACLQRDQAEDALVAADRAYVLHTATGHRLGLARALLVRGKVRQRLDQRDKAESDVRAARELFDTLGTPSGLS